MREDKKAPRILAVDDNEDDLCMILWALEEANYKVVCAKSVPEANEVVLESLKNGERFDIALVDLAIGPYSGAEFARRLKDIVQDINVIVITGNYDPKASMIGDPDKIIIKTEMSLCEGGTILEAVEELSKPKRIRQDSPDVVRNRWVATSHLVGINSLRFFTKESVGESRKSDEKTKKIVSLTEDNQWVTTILYPGIGMRPTSLQTGLGCNKLCRMCDAWEILQGPDGKIIHYLRPLTSGEISAQSYLLMSCPETRDLFKDDVHEGLVLNYSGPGEFSNNYANCISVYENQWMLIEKPVISLIITSVGDKTALRKYLDKHIHLPRVTFYWSLESVDLLLRSFIKPGVIPGSPQYLAELRDLYQEIAERTGIPVTASFALFKELNCTREEAFRVAEFFCDRWAFFKIKLMPGRPGSMRGYPDMTDEDLARFENWLIEAGVPPELIRKRKIFGQRGSSGCGQAKAAFIAERMKKEKVL